MGKELTILVQGKPERLKARALVAVLAKVLEVLGELDEEFSETRKASVQWEVAKVSMRSPLSLTLAPKLAPHRPDTSTQVVRSFLNGFQTVEREATFPERFSDNALKSARELLRLLDDGVGRIAFSSPGEPEVVPTLHAAANIDEVVAKQTGVYYEDATFEGVLKVISDERNTHVEIRDVMTNTKVPCLVTEEQLNQAMSAFRKRVAVTGRARMNRRGKALALEVQTIRVLRDSAELPQPKDFEGKGKIDITGGMESSQYVRGIRDAD